MYNKQDLKLVPLTIESKYEIIKNKSDKRCERPVH